jgi:hypothetical protein
MPNILIIFVVKAGGWGEARSCRYEDFWQFEHFVVWASLPFHWQLCKSKGL